MADILIIDDEEDIRTLIAGLLEDENYKVRTAHNSASAQEAYLAQKPRAVILDVWLKDSDMDGLKLLQYFKSLHQDVPIIIISGHGTIDMAVEATKMGAYSFITKPFKMDEILHNLSRALEEVHLREQNTILQQNLHTCYILEGQSRLAKKLRETVQQVSNQDNRLVILGNRGMGKESLSRNIHHQSARKSYPCRHIHCGHFHDDNDFMHYMFGHEHKKTGLLEEINGGTLLIEDPHLLSENCQKMLAQFLHRFTFKRVGGTHDIYANIRIISLVNEIHDITIWQEQLFSDLYQRLNIQTIILEDIEKRYEDIEAIIKAIIHDISQYHHITPPHIDEDAMNILRAYKWHGNIRECKHVIERLLLHDGSDNVNKEAVQACLYHKPKHDDNDLLSMMQYPLKEAKEAFEKKYINHILTQYNGNVSQAAQFMQIDRVSLHRKMK